MYAARMCTIIWSNTTRIIKGAKDVTVEMIYEASPTPLERLVRTATKGMDTKPNTLPTASENSNRRDGEGWDMK